MTDQPPTTPEPPEPQPWGRPDSEPAPGRPEVPASPWAPPPPPTQPWGAPVQPSPPPASPPPPPAATSPWPTGWGTPPPVWQPPAWDSQSAAGGDRRNVVLVGAVMLAVGLGVGAVVTAATVSRNSNSGNTTPLVADNSQIQGAASGSADVVAVAQKLGPAVGTIIAKHSVAANDALGSGFVISHDSGHSYMLTNNHVVEGATSLNVVMPGGKNLAATVVGTDSLDDLAVVSVADSSLPVSVFGDSSQLKVGQQVVAIGSPLGNEGSVTSGIISSLHRTINAGGSGSSSETLQDVLQTDASINPGNSGGPLADTEGRVVGVNVAVAGNASNIGFSIPSVLAKNVADDLINHRTVGHPFLGISYLTAIDAVEQGQGFDGPGVLISQVSDNSPASKAGFRANDILEAVDNINIDNGQTLGGLIQRHRVGDTVDFTVKRGDQVLHLSAQLVDRPASAG